jgi:hypothetical protein
MGNSMDFMKELDDARDMCRDAAKQADTNCSKANDAIREAKKFCNDRDSNKQVKEAADWVAKQAGYRCQSGASTLMLTASAALIAASLM